MSIVRVRYIDVQCWRRWRHARLRAIWQTLAEVGFPHGTEIVPFMNPGRWSHAECLEMIWDEERKIDNRWFILTEMDFLPAPEWDEMILWDFETDRYDAFCPIKQRANAGDTEVWLALFDMSRLRGRDIRWDHPRDPAADLHDQIAVQHFTGELRPEEHPGWEYPYGVHLLWQRHLHDPPEIALDIAGKETILVGDVQRLHDRYVEKWLAGKSTEFLRIYKEKLV